MIEDGRVYLPDEQLNSLGVPRIPKCSNEILELAKKITLDLNAPFISVDCYATNNGARYGELTYTPGGPWYGTMYRFSNVYDIELGTEWLNALKRLGLEIPLVESSFNINYRGKVVRSV